MAPDLLSAEELRALLLFAAINPAVFVVGLWLGRQADQWQKVPVAAFAAALAGAVLVWLAARAGIGNFPRLGRAGAGFFVAHFFVGLLWAAVAFRFGRGADHGGGGRGGRP